MITADNVAGVMLPIFNLKGLDEEGSTKIGMTGGGQAVNKARDRYQKYLTALVKIASL